MHVRGYKEKGNINTPLELAINNQIDRFSLAMDVIDRVPRLQRIGGHAKERSATCRSSAGTTRTRTASTSRKPRTGSGRSSEGEITRGGIPSPQLLLTSFRPPPGVRPRLPGALNNAFAGNGLCPETKGR